jgi:hypothetical protein
MHPCSWFNFVRGSLMWLVGFFLSCGGASSSSPAETPASAADVEAMCQAGCDQDQMCRGSVDTSCLSDCIAKVGSPGILSREALALYAQCVRDPACRSDDECEAAMGARDPAIETERTECSAFLRGCPNPVEGGLCLRIRGLLPDVRAKWKQCYTGTCSDTSKLVACIEAASTN